MQDEKTQYTDERTQYGDENTHYADERTQYADERTQYSGSETPPTPPAPPSVVPSGGGSNMLYKVLFGISLLAAVVALAFFLFKKSGDSPREVSHEVVKVERSHKKSHSKERVKPVDDEDDDEVKYRDAEDDEDDEEYEEYEEEEEVVAPTPAPTPTSTYHNLSGSINYKDKTYYIRMQLTVTGSKVTGQYVVTNGENVWVRLDGTRDSDGRIVVKEYKGGSPTTYYFDGKFYGSTFSGQYRTTARPLVMKFTASPE